MEAFAVAEARRSVGAVVFTAAADAASRAPAEASRVADVASKAPAEAFKARVEASKVVDVAFSGAAADLVRFKPHGPISIVVP